MELCVALDLSTKEENLKLVEQIKDYDVWLKVGLRTYIRDGKEFLLALKKINPNFKIFLDLKLYDIPNTMADAAEEIANLGVDMFNVHASAGEVAMQMVMQRLNEKFGDNRPKVLAVTVLTSFDENGCWYIYKSDISLKAKVFAEDADYCGLDGVVSSVFESNNIKNNTHKNFITLCPGIRPFGEDAGDQKRVANIKFAWEAKADFIVVGRPIYKAKDPVHVVKKILAEIEKNKSY